MMSQFHETKRKKPCMGCPFKKDNNLSNRNPGGSDPLTYIGQARGPFWLPCHNDKNYEGKESDPGKVSQCAGAAIFRSNCNDSGNMPKQILNLPSDKEKVFEGSAEFLSHYSDMSIDNARMFLSEDTLNFLLRSELSHAGVKRHT